MGRYSDLENTGRALKNGSTSDDGLPLQVYGSPRLVFSFLSFDEASFSRGSDD